MKCFLSGWQATNRERELAVINGAHIKHRCFSYAMIQKLPGLPYFLPKLQGAYDACRENGVGIMLDSGVFSWRTYRNTLRKSGQEAKLIPEDDFISGYVKYVKKHHKEWDFYVTIDLEQNAPVNYKRHSQLEAMGIRPMPVFHGDTSIDILKKYRDKGYTFIGLGTGKKLRTNRNQHKAYFDACFEFGAKYGIKYHGLAQTSPWAMLGWPWYSVDSSSWSRVAGYGGLMWYDEQKSRMSTFHVSVRHSSGKGYEAKMNQYTMDKVREMVKAEGFSLADLEADEEKGFVTRHVFNARQMLKLTDAATRRQRQSWAALI